MITVFIYVFIVRVFAFCEAFSLSTFSVFDSEAFGRVLLLIVIYIMKPRLEVAVATLAKKIQLIVDFQFVVTYLHFIICICFSFTVYQYQSKRILLKENWSVPCANTFWIVVPLLFIFFALYYIFVEIFCFFMAECFMSYF